MRAKLFFLLMLLASSTKAQLNNTMFEQRPSLHEADSNQLFFNIRVLGFNKNNEYFGKIADGLTLFGYQLNPSLSYRPTANTRIDAGVYVQKDFGNDNYNEVTPTFTFTYKHHLGDLIFGTLQGATSHRLIEPLYDFENVMIDRLENGLQFITINDWLFFDSWINWQKMLYRGENGQEELVGGISSSYVLMDKTVRLTIPFQLVVKHIGGQIDVSSLPLQTFANIASGLTVDFLRPDSKLLNRLRLDSYYVYYKDFSGEQLRPFDDGEGFYINAEMKSSFGLEFMISYWKANEFLSVQGGQLYLSESSSVKNAGTIEENRELLIFRLFHNMELASNLVLTSRFEPYFDIINNRFEFSTGFYINYNVDFYLLTANPKRP